MLEVVDIEYIRKKHFVEGWSIRRISRQLKYARQTVRKALASSQIPRYNLQIQRPSPVMDAYEDIITTWLKDDEHAPPKQRHTAKRIYDRLVEEYGFKGSDSTVRKFVSKLRPRIHEAYIPLESDFGEQAQVDWGRAKAFIGGKLTEICLFCLRLKASKVPFVWAFPTEKLEAFLEGHRLAFEWLGGVPGEMVYDNPKTAVVKILGGPRRQEHQVFSSLRAHYLFDSIFCRPGKAHEKGSVEHLVGYVRRNTMVPLPDVSDLAALNQHLLKWCEQEKKRQMQEWEQERPKLRPLPSHPFRCSVTRMVKVNKYSLVNYDRIRYSVPCQLVKQTLRLEAFADRVEVWQHSKLVATHRRSYARGETVLELNHYLDILERKPRAVMHAAVVRRLPEIYSKARALLIQQGPGSYKELCHILLLHREFSREQVASALETAIEIGSLTISTVRQLIFNQLVGQAVPAEVPAPLAGHFMPLADVNCYDTLLEVKA